MNYRSLSLWDKNTHIHQTLHKIFWEAVNRRLKSARCKARWHLRSSPVRIAINVLKLPYEANSKHLSKATMRSWKFSKSFSSVMFFRKGSSVLIPGFDSSLSRDANSTVSQLKWGTTTVLPCLVPRPHYYARPMRFGSRGPRKFLRRSFWKFWGRSFGRRASCQ